MRAICAELFGRSYVDDDDLRDTPARAAAMLMHFTRAWDEECHMLIPLDLFRQFKTLHDELVLVKDIEAAALCPHHLLPVHYTVSVAYVPNGRVLGLSKIPRLVQFLAACPRKQEDFTTLLADVFFDHDAWEETQKDVDDFDAHTPRGSLVRVVGSHDCMTTRGVRSQGTFVTEAIRGIFEKEPELRAEALSQLR
jgi:GTP cyclohydrolase I